MNQSQASPVKDSLYSTMCAIQVILQKTDASEEQVAQLKGTLLQFIQSERSLAESSQAVVIMVRQHLRTAHSSISLANRYVESVEVETEGKQAEAHPISLAALARQAFDEGDWELVDFYNGVEHELTKLRALGKVVGKMYEKGGLNDGNWQALFEALHDAGLLE